MLDLDDRLIRLCKQLIGLSLVETAVTRFEPGEDGEFSGIDYRYELKPGGRDIDKAREAVDEAMRPLDDEDIIKRLAMLKALTASRDDGVRSADIQIEAYTQRLKRWPADIVKYVLDTQPSFDKWWPAWAELETRLHHYGSRRNALARALYPARLDVVESWNVAGPCVSTATR